MMQSQVLAFSLGIVLRNKRSAKNKSLVWRAIMVLKNAKLKMIITTGTNDNGWTQVML
jgi:hypothetical protein